MSARRGMRGIADVVAAELCQGCGACSYACPRGAIELRSLIDVGIRPVVDPARCETCGECLSVCSGLELRADRERWPREVMRQLTQSWGPVLELWEGHAVDRDIWHRGGSGGVITALAAYCIERAGMHGALHVRADAATPCTNRTVLSRRRAELVEGAGSRYAPASPCADLKTIEDAPAACAFIGKPCDVAAVRMAQRIRPGLDRNIGLTLAVFCGGTPSLRGTFELLKALGVEQRDVADVRYRGCGWPGMTGVGLRTEGRPRVEMDYRRAWDTILTHYKPFRCHACPDGTGEFADIACGDPWYRPVQDGEMGSSLIVVRTELGRRVLNEAVAAGYVAAEPRESETLPRSQAGLLSRRRHVFPKLIALALAGRPRPRFQGFGLWRDWLRLPKWRLVVSFVRALRYARSLRRKRPLSDAPVGVDRMDGDAQISCAPGERAG